MAKSALLLVNLGSPESPQVKDVRPYLNQFLMDKEVIDIPYPVRLALVRGVIVPSRAQKSAQAYEKIFTERGSPLLFHTKDFTNKLKEQLKHQAKGQFCMVDYAMRYGKPSIENRLTEMVNEGIRDLVVIPLYPQFAKSSTRTVLGEVKRVIKKNHITALKVRGIKDFFSDPAYFKSFSKAIQEERLCFNPDHLLLSYHGLPESHVKEFAPHHCFTKKECCATLNESNRLCYRAQCFQSSRDITKDLSDLPYTVSFQSRLGRKEWIKPYSDHEIHVLLKNGVKRLLVACPAFVADCLETLEEVALRLRDDFIQAGGEDLHLVPSLNSRPEWVKSFAEMLGRTQFQELDPLLRSLQ